MWSLPRLCSFFLFFCDLLCRASNVPRPNRSRPLTSTTISNTTATIRYSPTIVLDALDLGLGLYRSLSKRFHQRPGWRVISRSRWLGLRFLPVARPSSPSLSPSALTAFWHNPPPNLISFTTRGLSLGPSHLPTTQHSNLTNPSIRSKRLYHPSNSIHIPFLSHSTKISIPLLSHPVAIIVPPVLFPLSWTSYFLPTLPPSFGIISRRRIEQDSSKELSNKLDQPDRSDSTSTPVSNDH